MVYNYKNVPSGEIIAKTAAALKNNGMDAVVVENAQEAKAKLFELVQGGREIMTMTSVTLDTIGASTEINESGKFDSVRKKLAAMDRNTQGSEMQKIGAAPGFAAGSVHAITMDGQVVVASNTGSQLPAYAYGSPKVIWVVGAQKIVENLDMAFRRIYEYVLPLESERARKAYGVDGSNVSKLLVVNKEVTPGRITVILVKEALGF